MTTATTARVKIWVEAPVIGKFVAKTIDLDRWEKSETTVAREVKKVKDMLRHKHPSVRVWAQRMGPSQ